jgi:hypothetical protein
MTKRVSAEDRVKAQQFFAQGHPVRTIAELLDNRVSASWISKTARDDSWQKGLLDPEVVAAGEPQIFESANASPEEMRSNTEKVSEVQLRRWQEHKAALAAKLGAGAERILEQIFAQHVVKEVKTVGMGRGVQDLRMVEVVLAEPSPADKKHLATALAILVDKASLLSGDATQRVETSSLTGEQVKDRLKHYRDELAQRRADAEVAQAKREVGRKTG